MRVPYKTDSYSYFGDACLENAGMIVERIVDQTPEIRTDKFDVAGGHGSRLRGLTYGERTIEVSCRVNKRTWAEFDAVHDLVNTWVLQGEQQLVLRNHPGQYYTAHIEDVSVDEDGRLGGRGVGLIDITFVASDPFRRSVDGPRTFTFDGTTSQQNAPVRFMGTYTPEVVIESTAAVGYATAYRGETLYLWGIGLSDLSNCFVDTRIDGSAYVLIDGRNHVAKAGATKETATITGLTPSSYWLAPKPGSNGFFHFVKLYNYGRTAEPSSVFVYVYDRWV